MHRLQRALAPWTALACLVTSSCGLSTEPVVFQDFQWLAVENATEVTEGMDAAAFAGDVALLGQLRTPTVCFRLSGNFTRDGSALTVRVSAQASNSATCGNTPGGYQYTAAIRGLDRGDYTLRVIHSVAGLGDKKYSKPIAIR